MAINLVSLVAQYLPPQLVGSLARAIGVSEAIAQKVVLAAIPTILAALASTAAAPGGGQKVSDAVANSDPDILTKVYRAATGGNARFLNEGATLLNSLLGGGTLSSLVVALSQCSGAPHPATQTLLGAVTHATVGIIGQQDPSNWSDPLAILSLLNSQKSAISAALPSEVSFRALGATGLLAGLGVAPAAPPPVPDGGMRRYSTEVAEDQRQFSRAAPRIFINYRRGDDPGYSQSLYWALEKEFGADNLFMDVEGRIRPGDDFVEILNEQVSVADIVLIVVGPRWLDLLSARKGDPNDFNLIEIEAAIEQRKRVIPVLVGGASIPPADKLPDSIRTLARRQAAHLSVDRFRSDLRSLIAEMKEILKRT
jgi:hypothetical protein